MEDALTKLLAGMKKPPRHYRAINFKMTDKEYMEFESYCTIRYLNYSEVIREAIKKFINQ